jgi:hypothetical protein
MSRVGQVFAGGALITALFYGLSQYQKANAANRLSYKVADVHFKSANTSGAKFVAKLALKNPTAETFNITEPFVTLFFTDKKGVRYQVSSSQPTGKPLPIKANDTTSFSVELEIATSDAITVMPDFVTYMLSRAMGAKSTRQAIINIFSNAEGFNINLDYPIGI